MMKAVYEMPRVEFELFSPNEAISACSPTGADFTFNCLQGQDTDTTSIFSSEFYTWVNTNYQETNSTAACSRDAWWAPGATIAVNNSTGGDGGNGDSSIDASSVFSWNSSTSTATLKDAYNTDSYLGMLYIAVKDSNEFEGGDEGPDGPNDWQLFADSSDTTTDDALVYHNSNYWTETSTTVTFAGSIVGRVHIMIAAIFGLDPQSSL